MSVKKLLAVIMALAMVMTFAAFPAFAADPVTIKPVGVTSPFTAAGEYSIKGTIDGSEAGNKNYFRANVLITSSGTKGNDGNFNFTVDLGLPYNITELYSAFGSKYASGVALWGSNDLTGEWTEIADLTLAAQRSTTAITHEGYYQYVKVEAYKTLDNNPACLEVTFKGVPDPSVVASYTVNYVDTEGNPLEETKNALALIGATTTEFAIEIPGYSPVTSSADITIDADSAKNAITFTYEKLPQITVYYLDDEGNEIAPAKILYLPEGTVVTENVKEIAGYTYAGGTFTQEITVVKGATNEIVFGNYLAIPRKEATKLPLTASDITWKTKSNASYHNNGDLSCLFDGDTTCPSAKEGFVASDWNTKDNTFIQIDLGGIYDVNTLKIYWGNTKKWDFVAPKKYTVSVAGEDGVFGDPILNFVDNESKLPGTGFERNDFLNFGAEADFVKYIMIHITDGNGRNPTAREIEVYAAESVFSTNSARVTINHYDPNGNIIAEPIVLGDVLGTSYSLTPTDVPGYKYIGTANLDVVLEEAGKNYVIDLEYIAIPTVSELPVEEGFSSTNATNVPFVFMTATPDNVSPEAVFAVANWATNNCVVESVEVVAADDPNTLVYEWQVTVIAVPNNNNPYSLTLDLPAEYELTDSFTFYREASDTLLDSAIASGETTFTFDKETLILNYDESDALQTAAKDRTIIATINVQDILETGLPYKGYNEVSIELTGLVSNGGLLKFKVEDFVHLGDGEYIGSIVATKAGVDRLQATVTLYGIASDGSKVALDEATLFSNILEFTAKYPVPQTDAQKLMNYSYPVDILDQLFDQVHPFDLPTFSDDEWDFFAEILVARGASEYSAQQEVESLKAEIERLKLEASEPNWVAPVDYPDNIYIVNGRYKWGTATDGVDADGNPVKITEKTQEYEVLARVGTANWNMLKDFHIESFSLRGKLELPSDYVMSTTTNEGAIDDAYITFRNGIDYDNTNFSGDDGFMIQVKIIGAQKTNYTDWNLNFGKAFNAIRRVLNDDQLSPILFRVDWYNWGKNPFKGGVITVKLTEDWIDNNGLFNLSSYRMTGYSYGNDNDPTLTLIEEDFCVANPVLREVSVEVKGAAKLYDSYAIVSTNKLPSELPETIGIYYDAPADAE